MSEQQNNLRRQMTKKFRQFAIHVGEDAEELARENSHTLLRVALATNHTYGASLFALFGGQLAARAWG